MFLVALLLDGALAGAIYALVALSFVVVYKASRMINFALGEWVMLGSRLVASGLDGLGLGLGAALGVGCVGLMAVAVMFNGVVLRRLVGQPLIALIMVTIGLGMLIRGSAALVFAGIPGGIALPISPEPLTIDGVPISPVKLVAAVIAILCVCAVTWLFHATRTGVALRAVADDPRAAMAVGIDIHRHFAITWALVGCVSVIAGTLWTVVSGGGFGMALVGVKVFPIVIIGGLDSIPGALVGALVIGVLESLAAGSSIRSSVEDSATSRPTWCCCPSCSCARSDCSARRTPSACSVVGPPWARCYHDAP